MPDLIQSEIYHHLLSGYARKEGHLTIGLRDDAAILAALVEEHQRCLAHGHDLRCSSHEDQGRILYLNSCAGSKGSDALGLGCGRHFGNINLHFCAYGSGAKEVALHGESSRAVGRSFVERELIVVAIALYGSSHLGIALEEFQGSGIHYALVLRHSEVDARHVVGIHHTGSCHESIDQCHVLLRSKLTANTIIVAACTRDGHVLKGDHLDLGHPACTRV